MSAPYTLRIASSLADISAADWNACAADETGAVDPFLDHAFFAALEESGSAVRATGWLGHHMVLEDEAGTIQAILPCYLKSHSRGEYVFDAGWAEAYERAGGRYYPKLQASVPFTPATGRRLLVRRGPNAADVESALAQASADVTLRRGASSLHVTFCTEPEWNLLGEAGFLKRTDTQFHFENQGYADFDAFLAALSSRKRKTIRRERRDALEGRGITIRHLTGKDLTEEVWDAFYAFYMDTGSRKWGRPYLTRSFYSVIGERMADRILLVMAEREGRYIAGAINFIGRDVLYGRHWGAIEEHPFLHFEVCYYQAIDYAISKGLSRVEAGAQGEHKLARGYRPVATHSAHYIADPGLRRAVADYLERERRYVDEAIDELGQLAPFRKGDVETE
ncbi:N-acetyltransferase [Phreatobacter aquaticus]|uniref:N-acetyltransferase n=1 Tax=Phreatobacter aquaticus TaxID=2570229 RepID=A0A4D7QTS1_9HYPH|nr:GNAT family N-acetyltransferase [Phreatobacter aquaticus]QCK87392.1 N-acetyltransferase [Phreatobacter aquaticus]